MKYTLDHLILDLNFLLLYIGDLEMLDWFFKRVTSSPSTSTKAEKNNGKSSDRLNGSNSSSKTIGKVSDIVKSNTDAFSPSDDPLSTSSTNVVAEIPKGGFFFSRCFDNSDCARLYMAMFKEH
uniref:Uncharacterized protein n=1 Tax=Panagrolaimus sp. PS1159 TaxID=55785 RepID=A0AC35GWV6_9BILA